MTNLLAFGACPDSVAQPVDSRAVLSVNVNEVPKDDIVVRLRGADIWVSVQDLQAAGLKNFAGRREEIDDRLSVSLASLSPEITYKLDVQQAALRITAAPSYFETSVVDLRTSKPPSGLRYSRDTSLFINYSVDVDSYPGGDQVSAVEEAGLSFAGKYLLFSDALQTSRGAAARGRTRLTFDDRWNLRRFSLGDTSTAANDPLGGSATIGGFAVARNFALDPYSIRFPQQSLSGTATTPSTVEVYRNGWLIAQERLPPGYFELQNIPFSAGAGLTELVIRDAFGRERRLQTSFFQNTQSLRPGLSEFSYAVGLERQSLGTRSFDYGGLAWQGSHRFGLTNWLSGGYRFEGKTENSRFNGGLVFDATLPIGALAGAAAVSSADGSTGDAAYLTYNFLRTSFNLAAQARRMSPHYTHLNLSAEGDRPLYEVNVSAGSALGPWVSVAALYSRGKFRDAGRTESAGLAAQFQLPLNSSLNIAANYSESQAAGSGVNLTLNLSFSLGENSTASINHDYQSGSAPGNGHRSSLQVQKSTPRGPGWGYLFQGATGRGQDQVRGRLLYKGDLGSYEIGLERQGGATRSDLTLSGSLVAVGDRLFASRPVRDAFALIRTPGLSGVAAELYNQPVGQTDSKGDLLVPDLTPHLGNKLSINEKAIPMTYQVDSTDAVIAPPFRGGAVVAFPVRPIQAVTGRLKVEVAGEPVVPAYGELTVRVPKGELRSPIGRGGEFYLDSPEPGRHPAAIEFEQGTCNFRLDVPKVEKPSLQLGILRCKMPESAQ